ncbi:hypothetical protein C1H76_6563 [Elsinoe australis]|uniref:Uncharacterized protein n=1 Tax=Elsinoe australis TaxID=40998 RepID=A0A4U7ARX1_9PEZI|nr:hypothetical protein C1H76_6563 [Elsinoe australis]
MATITLPTTALNGGITTRTSLNVTALACGLIAAATAERQRRKAIAMPLWLRCRDLSTITGTGTLKAPKLDAAQKFW